MSYRNIVLGFGGALTLLAIVMMSQGGNYLGAILLAVLWIAMAAYYWRAGRR